MTRRMEYICQYRNSELEHWQNSPLSPHSTLTAAQAEWTASLRYLHSFLRIVERTITEKEIENV